ncbi:MAG: cell envelope integrity protein TolA [Gammaproteobacteria bacterium]|nr:cell envelope integrity protein TolA [Gammaproteobacteria bacterium]
MKGTFNNVVIYNGYPLSVVVAVTFHSVILALLLYLQSSKSPEALELVQPTVVKALLIQENPQVANERKRLERRQQQQRVQEREVAQQAVDAEQLRKEQADARAEEQRVARDLASLRQRQEQEKLDTEQLVRERKEQEEIEEERRRQRELAEEQRKIEVRDRQRQQESADAAAAELATSEFEMVQSGTAIIQQAVQSVWSRPPSARNGMRAILQIRMLPTGELIDALISESSGDPAFDRSAENAVYSAAPFRELQALPINVFNANFRSLSLIFQPEDLLN